MLQIRKHTYLFVVEPKDTAAAMGSGDLEVLVTPVLFSMIEMIAKESIRHTQKSTCTQ